MLRVYSNQDNIVVGTPVSNRHYTQIENLIGFFVNTLALNIEIDTQESIESFIGRVGSEVLSAQLHQDLPFERLVLELDVEKDESRHPIFQIMFGMDDFAGDIDTGVGSKPRDFVLGNDLSNLWEPYWPQENALKIAKFDLSTFMRDEGERYDPALALLMYQQAVSLFSRTLA